uniref:Uncharacterized protein n=1 Tax=Arundo donax TaxID=35708 RepID=A0A0A9ACE8_ARUDO
MISICLYLMKLYQINERNAVSA